jgi:Cell Wall Hydrolase
LRIRFLLLLLAILLPQDAAPLYAALGDAPRCMPPSIVQTSIDAAETNPLVRGLRRTMSLAGPEDRDYIIRTIVFEASGEEEVGKAAVAHVILNRWRSGRWGDTVKDVVTHPWQFEPWMTKKRQIENLSPNDPRYRDAARIADDVLSGARLDPTAGATHFLNPTIVRERRGGTLPAWAQGVGQPIGNHTFFKPEEDDPELQPELSPIIVANAAQLLAPKRGAASTLLGKQRMPASAGAAEGCEWNAETAGLLGLIAPDLVQLGRL